MTTGQRSPNVALNTKTPSFGAFVELVYKLSEALLRTKVTFFLSFHKSRLTSCP